VILDNFRQRRTRLLFGGKSSILKIAFPFLLLYPLNASAFLFGGVSDKKAEDMLGVMSVNFENGDCRAVAAISQDLFREKPSSAIREKAYSYLGRCYETQGNYDKAIMVYKLAHGLYPENDLFSGRLASIYLKTGFYDIAIPLFEKVLKGRSYDIEANAGLARCYAFRGFLSKAKIYYSRAAILCDFGDLGLLKEYASQMLRIRDWDEAGLIAGYGIKLAPGEAYFYEVMARIAAGRGDYKVSAGHMRSAIRRDPESADLALELALVEFLAGDYDAALGAIPAAGTRHRALSLLIRGMALHKKGERVRALEHFKEASDHGDSFISAFAASLMMGSH